MKRIVAAALLLVAAGVVHAAAAVAPAARLVLARDQDVYRVVSAQVLADPTNGLTIEGLRAREKEGQVTWETATRFNFGYTTARRWLKLTVTNQSAKEDDWLLELGYPLIQGVEFHQFTNGSHVAENKTGRLRPFGSRSVAYHSFLFPFSVSRSGVTELYVMAESNGTLFVPLSVSTKEALLAKSVRRTTGVGIYVGIILAMALYNLFLLFAFRDRNYLYYIVYAATFCLLLSSLNGMTYQYLWPDWPAWNKVCVPVLVGISYLFLALFTKSFLETRRLTPRMDYGLNAVIAGALFLILGGAFSYGFFVNRFTSLFISAVPLVMIPISARCAQLGSHVAIYYLIAFGCFFVGSGTHAARDLGWLPQNFVTENGPYLGSAAEMLFLSLGLAARIKRLKEESLKSEIQAAQARRELAESKDLLAQQLAVSALASQVAHDIRSPLAALDVVEKDLSQLAERKRVMLRGAISRIRDIANSLLAKDREIRAAISEPRAVEPPAEPTSVELVSSLVDAIVSEKRLQYRAKAGLTIEADLGPASYGLFACVDPAAFKRDLSNIINNAVEAIGNSGRVLIGLKGSSSRVIVTITDDGTGIDPDLLPRLGQRGLTAGKAGGLGLGVHHAKSDAVAWGGDLTIDSAQGKGTTVTISLPRSQPPGWFVPALEFQPGEAVVVLDDDASIHQVWQERFESLRALAKGVVIRHFFRPSELRAWVEENPDQARGALYLVDYELMGERQTGLDLIAALDLTRRAILVTSRAEERPVVDRCLRMGVKIIPKNLAVFVPASVTDRCNDLVA